MGNRTSNDNDSIIDKNKIVFSNLLENIAENYILTQNFQDLLKLNDPQYCEKIIVLTTELLNENLNTHEIEYISQKTKSGMIINEKTKKNITFATKEQFNNINKQIIPLQKKRLCVGIARFFIKIAQLYSAIFSSLNPLYVYTDSYGKEHILSLTEKNKLPSNVKTKKIHYNICSTRINSLTKNSSIPDENNKNDTMFIHPDFCSAGINSEGRVQSLIDQIGIIELEKLYYDIYDFDSGKFNKMSDEMKKQYDDDIKILYSTFTGDNSNNIPTNIKTFSDIKMKIYNNLEICNKSENPYNIKHYGTLNDKLFMEYATHIKKMQSSIEERQQELLDILKDIFISVVNPENNKNTFSIHPNLDTEKLNLIISKTIKILITQYVSCEKDYLKGLQIYEAIVENKIQKLTQEQIKQLEKQVQDSFDKENLTR